jgi:hypothetical protein
VTDLIFVWNTELQKWIAVGSTLARFAKDNTLPPEAQFSGSKVEKNGKLYLLVPRSKEADLVKLNPDFAQGQNPVEEQLTIVRDIVAKPIKAYDKWYEENKNKPLAEALGIPKEGIADAVTTSVKSFLAGRRGKPVDIDAPLPGTIVAQETGIRPGVVATPTGKGVLGSDYIPSSFTAEPAIAGVNYSAITIDDEENLGLFTVNKKANQLLLPQATGGKSELVDANKFVNVTLYNLPPEKVKQYQAKYGVNQTGKMNAALAGKIFSDARKASYENYVRSNPEVTTDKTQVSWEDAVINPASIGGVGDGSGISAKQIRSSKEAIRISANQLGVTLDDAKLNSLANSYARGDISASVLPYEIARQGEIDYTKGAAGNTYNKLRELASAYGIQYSEDWYKNSVAGILSGKESEDTYDINIKELAKSKYPTLAKQIDAGRNVRDLASPYIQTMSQILELSPDAINVDDFYINQALTGLDAEGNPKQKPLWEFQQQLRQDPRWNYTRNAQDSLMDTARKVLQDFGLVS